MEIQIGFFNIFEPLELIYNEEAADYNQRYC